MKRTFFIHYSLLIALFLLLIPSPGSAYFFQHYTINEGLSNNAIYSIYQDSQKLMWFGTIDGLHSFDGKRIRVWRSDDSRIRLGSIIYAITEDDNQCLWIASDAGLALLNLRTDEFMPFKVATSEGITVDSRISDVAQDSRKNIWIASVSQGLFCYHPQSGELELFTAPDQLLSNRVKDVMEDRLGMIWVTTLDNGISCYNPTDRTFRHYRDPRIQRSLMTYEDSQANLWIGNAGQGLFLLDRNTGEIRQKIRPEKTPELLQIRYILEWKPGTLLLASDEGLIHYDISKEETKVMKSDDFLYGNLNDGHIHTLFIDHEQGLWVGTYFGGVNYLSPTGGNFSYYNSSNTPIDGRVISAFAKDKLENLWIATDDAGFFYWDRASHQFTAYKPQGTSRTPTYQNTHALLPDGDRLYIGMYMGGLDILDLKTGIFRNYTSDNSPHSLYSSGVYSLCKDMYGDVWVGTSFGLNRYNPKDDNFDRIAEVHPADVTCIIEDQRGFLWATSLDNGLFRLDRKTQQWINYRHDPEDKSTLPTNKLFTACLDNQNRLWFGTDGSGLCRYDYENDCFIRISLGDPALRVIYKIIPDNENLWISTSTGLLKFQPELHTCKLYNRSDGLQDNQFSPNAGIKMADGTIYFGGINGFNGFRPTEMVQNNQIPEVILTDFLLFNKHVDKDTPNNPLETSIRHTKQLTLNRHHSIFTLEFAALSYTGLLKNRYRYKLEGFENEWTDITGEPRVTYTNLPPGRYTFRVNASNGDGVWNEKGIALPIRVLPPWWFSYPAIAVYILVLIASVFYLFERMRRQHRKKLAYLEVKKDREVYEAKMDFFTHIVHEIRTPLSLILAPLDHVMRSTGRVSDVLPQLQVIERNGKRLSTLVNQLMDFRKVEAGGMKVSCRISNVNDLVEDIYKRFRLSAELKNIQVLLSLPPHECMAYIDPEAFTKIMSNLLSNALKFTNDCIWIDLQSNEKTQKLELRIRDNGPGIPTSEQQNIFKPFYQVKEDCPTDFIGTGIGLLLVKKLVRLLHGELDLESEIGNGSVFIVRLDTVSSLEKEAEKEKEAPISEPSGTPEPTEIVSRHTLLIVDDNQDLLDFLYDLFAVYYEVVRFPEGEAALNYLSNQTVDLVISDVMMPKMNGFELCAKIKSKLSTSHIPVLLLTAKVAPEDQIEGLESGADVYVEKPFSADILKAQVQSLLINRERVRKNFQDKPMTPLTTVAHTKMDKAFLERMAAIIEEQMSNPEFTVEALAQELCMGRSTFFAKVKGVSGMTPNDFIRVIRLKQAARIFMEGETSISNVCFQVGFSSPSYFSRCFQQQFGMSPSDFLKQI